MRECTESRKILACIDAAENTFVQAHINSISFPTDIEGLEVFIYEHGHFNIEDILWGDGGFWTVPRNCKIGDLVLWFHAKTAISKITALITKVKALDDDLEHNKNLLLEWLEHARQLYKKYGGKIFAVGRITSSPEYYDDVNFNAYHFHGRTYADIGDIVVLDEPVDISEFNSFIAVSRHSAITPLPSNEFNKLRKIILKKNGNLPEYFLRCKIGDFKLSNVNFKNFLKITKDYRRRFLYEIDFRSYYVNYILRGISKKSFYLECVCHSEGKPHCFVDNVFKLNSKYYLLEVKLNINIERNLPAQLEQYINADYIYLEKSEPKPVCDFEKDFMYVIDTDAFYIYYSKNKVLKKLINLDEVKEIDDIKNLIG